MVESAAGGRSAELQLDGRGELVVPAGSVRILGVDPRWRCIPENFELEPGDRRTAWAVFARERRLVVSTLDGESVEGAAVYWTRSPVWEADPASLPKPEDPARTDRLGTTGPDGRLRVNELFGGVGTLVVQAEGFRRGRFDVAGAWGDELRIYLRRTASESRRGGARDRLTGVPLAGVRIDDVEGRAQGASGSDGSFSLPCWLDGEDVLVARAEGYCDTSFRAAELESDGWLELSPAARLDLTVVGGDELDCAAVTFFPRLTELALGEIGTIEVPSRILADETCAAELRVPVGESLEIVAIADTGASSVVALESVAFDQSLEFLLTFERGLSIRARDSKGRALERSVARVSYDSGAGESLPIRARSDGTLAIPRPSDVEKIVVEAEGRGRATLVPDRSSAASREGELGLELPEAHQVAIRARDVDGNALDGLAVELRSSVARTMFAEFPELSGRWPSAHPAWLRQHPPWRRGLTDGGGRVVLRGLEAGAHELHARIPAPLEPGWGWSMFQVDVRPISIPAPEDRIEWILPRPVRVSLSCRDAVTSVPLGAIRITPVDTALSPTRTVGGCCWQGWAGLGAGRLRVESEGYEPVHLELERLAVGDDGVRVAELELWPISPGEIVLRGASQPLLGQSVEVVVARVVRDELGHELFATAVWRGPVRVSESSSISLSVPIEGELTVSIEPVSLGGQRLTFEPPSLAWLRGEVLELEVVSRSVGAGLDSSSARDE